MVETVISIRTARLGDEAGIARVHDAAWRDAYRGVIPGRELERMIQRRGPVWWRRAIVGGTRLMVLDFADTVAGYASYGRNRMPALPYSGEIFELYIAPGISGRRASAGGCSRRRARSGGARLSVLRRLGAGRQRARARILPPARRRDRAAGAGTFGAETRERVAFGFRLTASRAAQPAIYCLESLT